MKPVNPVNPVNPVKTDYEKLVRRNNVIDLVVSAVCLAILVGIILLSTAEGCIISCN